MIAQIPGEFSASSLSLFYNSYNPSPQRPLIWHKSVLMKETFSSQLGSVFFFPNVIIVLWGLPWWLRWQRICLQCGRPGFNPWVGKIPWRRSGYPLQYLENSMGRGAWQVQSMGSQRVRIEQLSSIFHFHYSLKVMSVYFPISTFNFRNISHKPCLYNIKTTKQFR